MGLDALWIPVEPESEARLRLSDFNAATTVE